MAVIGILAVDEVVMVSQLGQVGETIEQEKKSLRNKQAENRTGVDGKMVFTD